MIKINKGDTAMVISNGRGYSRVVVRRYSNSNLEFWDVWTGGIIKKVKKVVLENK